MQRATLDHLYSAKNAMLDTRKGGDGAGRILRGDLKVSG